MKRTALRITAALIAVIMLGGCSGLKTVDNPHVVEGGITINRYAEITEKDIPEYSGRAYININKGTPGFTKNDLKAKAYEHYSTPDRYGRCRACEACLGNELMPKGERGDISAVEPTGWQRIEFNFIEGELLYNRCHLLGFQLTGENANENNLITGTRYLNIDGMLPFENTVADYINKTGNHVLYRVTPVFFKNELVARGVQMEGYSVEDGGEGVCFNVFCYNVQPGVEIDYLTGNAKAK